MSIEEILRARGKVHGDFKKTATLSYHLKTVLENFKRENNRIIETEYMEALMNIMQKVARILGGDPNHLDHWIDIKGYAELARKEAQKRSK